MVGQSIWFQANLSTQQKILTLKAREAKIGKRIRVDVVVGVRQQL
jgi:hypothetical protein